jgi:predicted NBD/HSP70 family sugar kinase
MNAKSATVDARSMRGSNHNGMRQFNERIVLQAIRHHGAIPKADLARVTQLSTQTVAIIVKRLEDDGLVLKCPRIRGRIGQPSVPLSLNPDGAYGVGLQVGRRNLEVMITNFAGQPVWQHETRYDYPDPRTMGAQLHNSLRLAQERLGDAWHKVVGIGVTAPLSMHQWVDIMGEHASAGLLLWRDYDLRSAVSDLTDLPVVFAKDTMAACLAELFEGHGRVVRNFLYVFVGTFVGGGLVLDGQLVSGPRGNAGAIGSLPMATMASDHAHGTASAPAQLLEVASGWQLEQAFMAAGIDTALVHDTSVMSEAYSPHTQAWLARASQALAMTSTSAAAFMDLDAVVIDGSLGRPLIDALIAQTQAKLGDYRLDGMHTPQVIAGRVGPHARALGGSLIPLHSQFFPNKDVVLKADQA